MFDVFNHHRKFPNCFKVIEKTTHDYLSCKIYIRATRIIQKKVLSRHGRGFLDSFINLVSIAFEIILVLHL